MKRSYTDYINIIDEMENIEQVLITDNKIKKCCYYSLESVIEVVCPTCKRMLELKNELQIQKKGNCKCSCIPTSFKLSKNDKRMNIDKTKDSINLETDVHNITFKWGRDAALSENGDNETQETIREMMKN